MSIAYSFEIGRSILREKSPSFEAVLAFAQKSGFCHPEDWRTAFEKRKLPSNFPRYPEIVFSARWPGWNRFFAIEWLRFDQARLVAINELVPAGVDTSIKYKQYAKDCNLPRGMPRKPDGVYKEEWRGWRFWFGKEEPVEWRSFDAARAFSLSTLVPLGIDTSIKYIQYAKDGNLPCGMPRKPDAFYKSEWLGWGFWFGKEDPRSPARSILSFHDAMAYVQNFMCPLGIDTLDKYVRYVNPPQCLPNDIAKYYKHRGWVNSSHFFGTSKRLIFKKKNCSSYEEVKAWCQENLKPLGIAGQRKLRKYLQGHYENAPAWPGDFPRNVENYYDRRKQWVSYSDLFGDAEEMGKDSPLLHHVPEPSVPQPHQRSGHSFSSEEAYTVRNGMFSQLVPAS